MTNCTSINTVGCCPDKACTALVGHVDRNLLIYVDTYKDLKNLKECSTEKLVHDALIVVKTTNKVVSFDSNTGKFYETSINLQQTPIDLSTL